MSPSHFTLGPVGLEAGVLISLFLSVCTQQGSTESNATNDEEEMKGRKGTRLIFFLLLSTLFLSPILSSVF